MEQLNVHNAFLYCNNKSAIHLTNNPVLHERSKHLEIDYRYIGEKVEDGIVRPVYIPSKQQVTDIMTKGLYPSQHRLLISKMNVQNICIPLEGESWSGGQNVSHSHAGTVDRKLTTKTL